MDRLRSAAVWALRAAWALLPLLAGPALGAALDPRSRAVQLVASIGLWAAWAVVLVAALVPTTVSLTAVRAAAPAALLAAVLAVATGEPGPVAAAGALAGTALAALLALLPEVGAAFVQGSAYGDEVRLPLRPPGSVLLVALPLAWLLVVAGAAAGPLLLAARQWVVGALALAVGAPAVVLGLSALHRLSRRWLVFVPAGLVVHDHLALAETVLVRRPQLDRVTVAPQGTTALDLTAGALGGALEVRLTGEVHLATVDLRGRAETRTAAALLVAPTRPGAALAEAARRRLPVA